MTSSSSSSSPSETNGARRSISGAKVWSKLMPNSCSISLLCSTPWHRMRLMTARRSKSSSVQAVAAHGGEPAAFDALAVGSDVAVVLRVARADAADRADAHAVQIGAGLRRVALKIAVQRALALRHGQFVIRPREMVHADVLVSGVEKTVPGPRGRCGIFPCLRAGAWPARPAACAATARARS